MADNIFYPDTIPENEIIKDETVSLSTTDTTSGGTSLPSTIKDESFPTKKIAVEVIGTALNTKSKRIQSLFEFTQSGGIVVGEFEAGVQGDIKISPNGIVARDISGQTSFALDGTDGSAVFRGTIQGQTIVAGDMVVGDNSIRLDGDNRRIIIYGDDGIPFLIMGEY